MKKVLSIILALALIVGVTAAVGVTASAETVSVKRLTQTATNIQLVSNLTQAQAEAFASQNIPGFSNMGCFIYADAGNGQYNYIMDGQFGITASTGTIASIFADNCMRCVYINGTFNDSYVGVNIFDATTIKAQNAQYDGSQIPALGTITPLEVPNVLNALNANISGSHVAYIFKLYIADNEQTDWVVTFEKDAATDEFVQHQFYAPTDTAAGWSQFIADCDYPANEVIFSANKINYNLLDTPTSTIDLSVAGATATFRSAADFSAFAAVAVDGSVIDASNYTATQGSTIITLKNEYLATLADGAHTISILSGDGVCDASFTTANAAVAAAAIAAAKSATSPKTGDNALLLVSLCAVASLAVLVLGKNRVTVK